MPPRHKYKRELRLAGAKGRRKTVWRDHCRRLTNVIKKNMNLNIQVAPQTPRRINLKRPTLRRILNCPKTKNRTAWGREMTPPELRLLSRTDSRCVTGRHREQGRWPAHSRAGRRQSGGSASAGLLRKENGIKTVPTNKTKILHYQTSTRNTKGTPQDTTKGH